MATELAKRPPLVPVFLTIENYLRFVAAATAYLRKLSNSDEENTVFIGIHVRMTDTVKVMEVLGREFVGQDYFQRAMEFMAGKVAKPYGQELKV